MLEEAELDECPAHNAEDPKLLKLQESRTLLVSVFLAMLRDSRKSPSWETSPGGGVPKPGGFPIFRGKDPGCRAGPFGTPRRCF